MTRFYLVTQSLLFRRIIVALLVVAGFAFSFDASAQDIQITKSVNNAAADVGTTLIYTISVKSAKAASASVVIQDSLPAGVNYVSHVASVGTYTPATGLWSIGSMANNATVTLTITTTIKAGTSGTTINNIAKYISSSPADITPANNIDNATTTVNTADLSLLKTVSNASPNQLQSVSYTVKISNAGPSFAGNIVVKDTIPATETFGTVTTLPAGTTWSYDLLTGILTWNIPTLLTATNKSLIYSSTINTNTATQTIVNTSRIASFDQVDNNLANNQSTASLTVKPQDIRVVKTVSNATPDEGTNVVYTITATNLSGGDVIGLSILDTLPTGVTFVSYTSTGGTYDSATGVWDIGALADLASTSLSITASVNGGTSGTTINNTARYIGSKPTDNISTNNISSAAITVRTADLSLSKTQNDATPNQGQAISYTLKVTNAGPSFAGNVEVIDTIPAGLTFVTVTTLPTGSWTFDPAKKILKWSIPSILITNYSLVYTATVNSGTATQTIRNNVYISQLDQVDNNIANNNASVSLTVNPQDVRVVKTVNPGTADEASNVVYTITATNLSGGDLSALSILDTLPSRMSFVSYTADAGTYNSATGVWNVGPLADLASKNLYITAKINGGTSGTSIANTARYLSSTPTDNISTNNISSATVTVNTADLSVLKTVSNANPNESQTVSYTIKVTNAGPSVVSNVEISDTLRAGLTFVGVTTLPSGSWTYDTVTRIFKWNVPALALTNQSLVYTVTINSGTANQTIRNSAYITKLDQVDNILTNNNSTVNLTVKPQDISVVKTVNNTTPDEGTNIIYTIAVTNISGANVTALNISDTLPAGLTYVSYTADIGTYNPATGIWNVGALAQLATKNLYITAKVTATGGTTFTNTARYVSSSPADNNTANNISSVSATVTTTDLKLTKTVDDATPDEGQTITYSVKLTNVGPSASNNIVVIDTIPAGFNFLTVTTLPIGTWSYDSITRALRWNIASVISGQISTLVFTVKVGTNTSSKTISNTATITAHDQVDINATNDKSSVSVTVNTIDISLTKTVDDATPDEGQTITYSIKLANSVSSVANNIIIKDTIPSGLSFVAFVNSPLGSWAYDSITKIITWNISSIAASANTTLQFSAKVNQGTSSTSIVNRTLIASHDQVDIAPANDKASVSVTVNTIDISLVKTVNDNKPDEGQTITYSIKLTNSATSVANNITITDTIPNTLSFVSFANAPIGSFTYDSINKVCKWIISSIAVSGTATLQINARVNTNTSSKILVNTAAIISHDQVDINAANDKSSVSVTVNTIDIGVTKTVNDPIPDEGQTITYSLKLTNAGVGVANNMVITDTIPSTLSFVTVTASRYGTWSYDSVLKVLRWSVPSILAGLNDTLQFTAKVNSGTSSQSIVNTAAISSHDQVDITPANDKSSVTVVVSTTDVTLLKTVDDATPDEGQTINYSIKLSDIGTSFSNNIVVKDTIPSGLTFVTVSTLPTGTWAYDVPTKVLTWNVPAIAAAANYTLVFTAKVNAGTSSQTITNRTSILSHDQVDINPANDKSSVAVVVNTIDIVMLKTVDDATPDENQTLTYSVKATNSGLGTATNITIKDTIPADLTFVTVTTLPSGTWNFDATAKILTWNVPAIAAAGNYTLQFTAKVNSNTSSRTIINSAVMTSHDQVDINPVNDKSSVSAVVNTIDIALTKTVDDATPDEGQTLTYSVKITNSGLGTATGLVITDTIPSGLTFLTVGILPVGTWSYDSTTRAVTWNVPAVAAAGTYTMQFTARVDAFMSSKTIVNTAAMTSHDEIDINATNDKSSVSVLVNTVEVSMLKTVDDVTPDEGQTITYSLKVTNAGNGTAMNVTVSDTIPSSLTFLTVTTLPTGTWVLDSTTKILTWNIPSIASPANYTLKFTAKVNRGTSATTITNTAAITRHDQVDVNPANDKSSVAVTVNTIDISLIKTVDDATPDEGQTITYSVKLSNLGVGVANNIVISDTIPAGLIFLTVTGSPVGSWLYDSSARVCKWTVPSILASTNTTLQFTAKVNKNTSNTSILNTAVITSHDQVDINGANDKSSVSVTVNTIDISLTKTVNDATPDEGQTLTYSIKLSNLGVGVANNITITDTIPAGLSFLTVVNTTPKSWTYDSTTRVCTWTVSSIGTSANDTLKFTVKVNAGTSSKTITNNTGIIAHDQIDLNPGNDKSSVAVVVNTVDIGVAKTVDDATADEGQILTYSIKLTNAGVGPANNIVITDTIPAGLTFVTVTSAPIGSWAYDSSARICTWTVSSIAAATNSTLQFTVKVNTNTSSQTITNVASITKHDQIDLTPLNDRSTVSITVNTIDINLVKTVDNAIPDEGNTLTYSVKLSNTGVGVANNIVISDTIPSDLSFVNVTVLPSGTWVYDVTTKILKWTVPSVAALANYTLKFTATVNGGTSSKTITNTAVITAHDQIDLTPANDKSSVSVTVRTMDLSIVKTVNDNTPDEGQTLTYSVKITNAGPSFSSNIVMSDTIPVGFTFVTVTSIPTGTWGYDPTTRILSWNIAAIASAGTYTLQYTAKPNTGTSGQVITNTAVISRHDQVDVLASNDKSSLSVTVNAMDISVVKTVDNNTPNEGQTLTYSVKLTNAGPSFANNIVISDTIPAGLTYQAVTVTPTGTTSYNAATKVLTWNVPAMISGATYTLQFTSKVNAGTSAQVITNAATMTAHDQLDVTASNNRSVVPVTVNGFDISVVKTVDDVTPDEGQTLTYSVKLTNTGPSFANNIVISDTIPSDLTFVAVTIIPVGTYAYNATTKVLTWSIPAIASGAAASTLKFTAKVNAATSSKTITNTAVMTAHDQADLTPANDKSSVAVVVNTIDINVVKTVNDNSPDEAQTLSYSIKATNNGLGNATNLIINDTLPAGLTYVANTTVPTGTATYNTTTRILSWTIPAIATGANYTLVFTAKVSTGTAAKTITNTAAMTSVDQVDVNQANNQSALPVIVNGADLQLKKVVDKTTLVAEGDTLTYTITLTNNGPLTANTIKVSEVLSNKLTLISATPSKSNFSGGVWAQQEL